MLGPCYYVEILGPLLTVLWTDPINFGNFFGGKAPLLPYSTCGNKKFHSSVSCSPFRSEFDHNCSCHRLNVKKRIMTIMKSTKDDVDTQA